MTANADTGAADRVVVLDIVGLRPDHVDDDATPALHDLLGDRTVDLEPPFPAVTVPAQTTLATGTTPETHGDVANGEYDREADAVEFWERDRDDRDRIWESARRAEIATGALFFQHLIGTTADVAITPSPIEDENNDMIEMNCWTNPDEFYDLLEDEYGHFPLHNYWGPGAGEAGSDWILSAAREAVERYDPDLLWVYVPHLDYVGQREGPGTDAFRRELATVDDLVGEFIDALASDDRWDETAVAALSEYGFHSVERTAFPNRILREEDVLAARDDGDVDLESSDAFAMVDHQVAHVYLDEAATSGRIDDLARTFAATDGVDEVLDADGKSEYGVDHPNAGDLVLVAERDAWFQYYWWTDRDEAPPYATSMDIHAKPGYDPCELFFGDRGMASLDPSKVGGSHGRVDEAALGCLGWGGPAAPEGSPAAVVDRPHATDVAPTIAYLLGARGELSTSFDGRSLLDPD